MTKPGSPKAPDHAVGILCQLPQPPIRGSLSYVLVALDDRVDIRLRPLASQGRRVGEKQLRLRPRCRRAAQATKGRAAELSLQGKFGWAGPIEPTELAPKISRQHDGDQGHRPVGG